MNKARKAISIIILVIIVVLFAIIVPILLMPLCCTLVNDPAIETKSLLNELVDKPGTLKHTERVVFRPEYILATSTLSETLPLAPNQLCMSLGEFEEDKQDGFELIKSVEEHRIVYHYTSDQHTKIGVVCNTSLQNLEEDFEIYDLTKFNPDCSICPTDGKCCAVILRRS